jgi:cytochrome c553
MLMRLFLLLAAALALVTTSVGAAEGIEEKVKLCATCHGEKGVPINKHIPVARSRRRSRSRT